MLSRRSPNLLYWLALLALFALVALTATRIADRYRTEATVPAVHAEEAL